MAIRPRYTTAVIAIGDELRHDGGAAFAVMAQLARRDRSLFPLTTLATSVSEPGRLIRMWEGMELAVVVTVDPAPSETPLRVHRLELVDGELEQPATAAVNGARRTGLGEAVALARALDRLPERLVVYLVEGGGPTPDTGPTEDIIAVVEKLAQRVEEDILANQAPNRVFGDNIPLLVDVEPGSAATDSEPGPTSTTP